MEVISISSESENETENHQPYSPPNYEGVYSCDWNDDVYPPIDYKSSPANSKGDKFLKPEEEIEDFVTPKRPVKSNTANDEEETVSYEITDSSYIDNTQKKQCSPELSKGSQKSPKKRQKLSQEEKNMAKMMKEMKKIEKEKTREEKKAEQIKQKNLKAAQMENHRNLKPEENIKFIKVHIDNEIINSACGANIIPLLQQNNIQYVVESQIKSTTINWSKRRIEKIVNDFGEIEDQIDTKEENQLLYVLDWEKAVQLVHNNELLSHVEMIKSAYIEKKLTLIIFGLGKYFEYKKAKRNRDMKNDINDKKKGKVKPSERIFEEAANISKDQLEYALTDLQLLGKHNCRMLETPEELSSLVLNFTKSISQIEFKLDKQKRQEETGLGWFVPDANQCVKVDKNGNGLLQLWQQQICQFSSVGVDTAQAIVSQINSPLALVTQYEKCERDEGELLLQNIQIRRAAGILSTSRRVGPQLSKKIYKFFTSDDPDLEL